MALVQKLVTEDSYDATNTLIPAGHVGSFDTARLTGNERHLQDVGDFQAAYVQIAAIGPTGPNPTQPQQIPFDAIQGAGGTYQVPGKILTAERTLNADQRLAGLGLDDEGREQAVTERLAAAADNATSTGASADGTVAEVTTNLGGKTDAELDALRTAEAAGGNRKGVLSAIEAERAKREA